MKTKFILEIIADEDEDVLEETGPGFQYDDFFVKVFSDAGYNVNMISNGFAIDSEMLTFELTKKIKINKSDGTI